MIRVEDICPAASGPDHDAVFIRPRGELLDPARIRARMAEDFNDLKREFGCADEAYLLGLGWTRAHILRHAAAARDIAAKKFDETRGELAAMRGALVDEAAAYREPKRAAAPAHIFASAVAAAAIVACAYALCLAGGGA